MRQKPRRIAIKRSIDKKQSTPLNLWNHCAQRVCRACRGIIVSTLTASEIRYADQLFNRPHIQN